jgi:hypothetical protein
VREPAAAGVTIAIFTLMVLAWQTVEKLSSSQICRAIVK